jgi:DNA-binding SARP family transcriptional activator
MSRTIKVPVLAKLTPPRLGNVVDRERLYRLLGELRGQALIWLSAPAGSGKTTVVANWAKTFDPDLVWFQCDAGDADPASFFHFLSLAVSRGKAASEPLPRLTPDLYPSLAAFVRNYFREFFSRLKAPALVVFDNWQDVPASAPLREHLPTILDEVPRDVTLVIISREEPDANLSRALSSGRMATLGGSDLQLSEAEIAAMAARYEPMPGQSAVPGAKELYAVTHGWAAGVALLLRHESVAEFSKWSERHPFNQFMFDYFATEVFDRMEASTKEFMLRTACLEAMSADVARELTGNNQAEQILDRLVQRNVFTIQRPASGSYQYHPLLKEFLQRRVDHQYTRAEQLDNLRRAAAVLEAHQQPEAAIPLWCAAEDWTEATRTLVSIAPELMQQGRFQTLIEWISVVPEHARSNHGMIEFYLGACRLAVGSPAALSTLESAYALFVTGGDVLGQMLSAAQIVHYRLLGLGDLTASLPWVEILGRLLAQSPAFPSKEIELRIISGFAGILSVARPEDPSLHAYAERARRLVDEVSDVDVKAYAVANLLSAIAHDGDLIKFRNLAPVVESLLARRDLAPTTTAQLVALHSVYLYYIGDFSAFSSQVDRALTLVETYGLSHFALRLRLLATHRFNFIDDREQAGAELRSLEAALTTAPPDLTAHFKFMETVFCLSGGDFDPALICARVALDSARIANLRQIECAVHLEMAYIYSELWQPKIAATHLGHGRDLIDNTHNPMNEFYAALVAAELGRKRGTLEECVSELRRGLSIGWRQGYATTPNNNPTLFMRLIPIALEHGIEIEYCHYLIRKRNLKPPSYDVEHWPWPIKIYSLGRFEVVIDGENLESSGRAQHKPLDLLKALVTDRAGLNTAALLDQLWPDLDGDAARNALDLALHRLRRLLKHKDAVVTQHGRLSLNRDYVWVDAWALQTLCARDSSSVEGEALLRHAQTVLDLYRGPFLAEDESPSAFTLRDRLRTQWRRHVSAVAKQLEAGGRRIDMQDVLNRAIEVDPVDEEFHLQLMQCHRAEGRYVEGIAAYRRCRELLKELSGSEPSTTTRALGREMENEAFQKT